jgi:roadblock/LC7 domain-containing protein
LAHYVKLTRKEPKHMATLQELLDLEGVVVAGEFDFEGRMLDYEAKMDMPEEMAQMAAQFCAAVSVMLNTMASSFADRSGMNWVPQRGWTYSWGSGPRASETVVGGASSLRRPGPTLMSCSTLWT